MAKRGACKTENLAKPKPWREQIIKELLLCYGNVAKACRIVDIATWTFYREKRDNAEFRKLVNEIDRELTGDIEAGAIKRAIKGVRKPIFYKGEKCGEVDEYPEQTVMFLLKNRSKRYRKAEDKQNTAPQEDVKINITVKQPDEKPVAG